MAAIRGYFNSLDNKHYIVKIFQNDESEDYIEVGLAGDNPFAVSYNISNTPFESIRTSTATISIIHNTYLDELISPYAQGTKVKLIEWNKKTNAETCVWCGYLVPRIYNQAYVNCYETIELEAADCVSVLQYLDYTILKQGGCVTFADIINSALEQLPINNYYWPTSKYYKGNVLTPNDLGIFEKNFFENDTDDPWKLQDVISEMCKYLGVTLLQWGEEFYFVDYTAISQGDDMYYKYIGNYRGQNVSLSNTLFMSKELSMGNDADISFEPIFNKVIVRDNFYNVEELIPNIFDDKYLTNRNGEFFYSDKIEVFPPVRQSYVSQIKKKRSDDYKAESVADDEYTYFMRLYDHKYFESYYEESPFSDFTSGTLSQPYSLVGRLGATIVDFAAVDDSVYHGATTEGGTETFGAIDYANTLDFKRYLCICENHTEGSIWDAHSNAWRLVMKSQELQLPCQITKDSYLILNYNVTKSRYKDKPYLNPKWASEGAKGQDYIEGLGYRCVTQQPTGPFFRVIFGDKAYSLKTKKWVDKNGKIEDTYCAGSIIKDEPRRDFWNTELNIANTVTYNMNINESGYAIPLADVIGAESFYIEILCPQPSFWAHKELSLYEDTEFESHNGWTWLSDFSIKLCEKGEDIEKLDNDVVYENVIDVDSINEFGEITFKYTTWHPNVKPSYSNVVTWENNQRVMLTSITEPNLTNVAQTAEENMIERHILQYQSPTKKITHSLPISITPFDRMFGIDITESNTAYMQLGTEIDYSRGVQKITYIQTK